MTKVKICGITHPDDALHAVIYGADYIGLNFSPRSKRCISVSKAKEILREIKGSSAQTVALFVDETQDEIDLICLEAGIEIVQLHGEESRQSLYDIKKKSIYAAPVKTDGSITYIPTAIPQETILLFDCLERGSGQTFDWKAFKANRNSLPINIRNTPWMLAGGLNIHNVQEAISLLSPDCVDVASGVEIAGTVRKDPEMVKLFVTLAKEPL